VTIRKYGRKGIGKKALKGITAHLNPTPHRRAPATPIALADELRREGFAVWQNVGLRRHDLEFLQAFG
jgi:hypothetical protein